MAELPAPSSDAVFQVMRDEAVLVHLQTNEVFVLNATGARFWELLAGTRDREYVESVMLEEFDVSPTQLAAEIDGILGALAEAGLVERG